MILVADSGSTKADWLLIDKDGNQINEFHSKGLNPMFHDTSFVLNELNNNFEMNKCADEIEKVYFYGAGSSTTELKEKLKLPFAQYFKNAEINIDHDLNAAVFATADGIEPCISCILGTGSNSAFYDGTNIVNKVPALGYILGDEGSGSYFGKQLLNSYFYNKMPKNIKQKFDERYPDYHKAIAYENVYMKPNANVYLASFSRFLSDNKDEMWVEELIEKGLLVFIHLHVCIFENYQEIPTHFVGSIAFFFEDILKDICRRRRVNIGKVVKKPVYNLAKYHIKQLEVK